MATLQLKTTNVFQQNWNYISDNKYRFILNQGGTRSSKTISLCQLCIVWALQNPKTSFTFVRISFPTLRRTIMRDIISLLKEYGLYEENNHNKTEQIYTFDNGSTFEFLSADSDEKLKGAARDILVLNEATELGFDAYMQLAMRTRGKILIDYNPEDNDHWIYDVLKKDDAILIKSTYKDNPFLPDDQVKFIEDMINVDITYYQTYVLGERPTKRSRIYTHFQQFTDIPDINNWCYGLDFGYNHPSALIKVGLKDNKAYVKEIIYESGLTISDLINKMIELGIDKYSSIYCDSARPEIIEELRRSGFSKAILSNKNVKQGIDKVKSMEIYIHTESINLWKEYRLYNWKVNPLNNEIMSEEPVKLNDDGLDAMRYAIMTHSKGAFNEFYTNVFSF